MTNAAKKKRTGIFFASVAATALLAGAVGSQAPQFLAHAYAEPVRVDAPAPASFADVVEKVKPAVVSVKVVAKVQPASNRQNFGFDFDMPGFQDLPEDHPFNRFFRRFEREDRGRSGPRRERRKMRGQGSGFFISDDGYIVTNQHVIDNGAEFTVALDDGREFDAELVGSDERTDLAVLKIESDETFTYVEFADHSARVGDWVVAVGNPFGLGGTVTAGIVSARGRDIGAGPYDDFIQIDAPVNRGNSGGPAFNAQGQVIGVNTAIFSPSGGNVGIAFAIPAATAEDIVTDLKSGGEVVRGWLGVQIQAVTDEIATGLGFDEKRGVLVADPQADGPAAAAGIRPGDVILSVDGKSVNSTRELARLIADYAPNSSVDITVVRNGNEQVIDVTLGTLPARMAAAQSAPVEPDRPLTLSDLGITVSPAEDGEGVVVEDVASGSAAASRGIRPGERIIDVAGSPIKTPSDITTQIEKSREEGRGAVLMRIQPERGGPRFVAIPIDQG